MVGVSRRPMQQPAQLVQSLAGRHLFEREPVPRVVHFPDLSSLRGCDCNEHGAGWLRGCATRRPRDSSHCNGVVGLAQMPGAIGHFSCDGLTDRAVPIECFSANAQKLLLRVIAICHPAGPENGRGSGDIRQLVRDAAAGAGFGESEGFLARGQ